MKVSNQIQLIVEFTMTHKIQNNNTTEKYISKNTRKKEIYHIMRKFQYDHQRTVQKRSNRSEESGMMY